MANVVTGPQQFDLPPELWPRIFAHLQPQQLLSLRLVCRRWKAIADRERPLWNRICIHVPDGVTLDARFRMKSCAPSVTCLKLNRANIVTVDSWWRSLGERLTCIEMRDCRVALGTLLGMLRCTPNLRRLSLRYTAFTCREEPVVNFKLDRMEELDLYFEELFEVYVRIFPRLRRFSYDHMETDWDGIRDRLIQSTQGTLQHLEFYPTAKLLQAMTSMDRLRLSSVTLFTHMQDHDQHDAARLCRVQQSLERLVIPGVVAQDSILCEIGRNLRGLKVLDTYIEEMEACRPTFLATMPNLELLTLRGYGKQPIDFTGFSNPNLRQARFWYLSFEQASLSSFLNGSPNLQLLSLSDCDLTETRFIQPRTANLLQTLELLDGDHIPNKSLLQLTTRSPHLKTLTLNRLPNLDDATFRALYRALPRLTQLTLEACDGVTVFGGLRHLLIRWPSALERVEVRSGEDEAVRKLVREVREGLEGFGVRYEGRRLGEGKESDVRHQFSR
ncbi:uncharacterized protein LOC120420218 [Culex pipiens pallens]|uniref:uncharacterized protein LOC120420218 n=1 Tax=Culex pipiens pallens TaxID=42434 RepID=UPI001952FF0D|nr:uncharacterized protein LOC120420218 [Culex pipiens pallens]